MILRVEGLTKRYGAKRVVDQVSFSFEGPGVLVLRGENGAGKSTLLSMISGVLLPDSGAIAIDGKDLGRDRRGALAGLGYAPDRLDLPLELTPEELVGLVASIKGAPMPSAGRTEAIGCSAFWRERLGALSLGQRRRTALLMALVGDPPLLVLDEPTNGLDPGGLDTLAGLLRTRVAEGRSALVATHDVAFAERIATSRIALSAGRIAPAERG